MSSLLTVALVEMCKGDQGGPLMYQNPSDGKYVIVGKSIDTKIDLL